jgi:hypothetical protein
MFSLILDKNESKSILDGITCYEPANFDLIKELLKTDLIQETYESAMKSDVIGNEQKQLQRYLSLINRETKFAEIHYKRSFGYSFGRCNPERYIGMFGFRRTIRQTLASRLGLSDFDMINAHPTILLQICQSNGLTCDHLKKYCENRDDILKNIMQITNCDRQRAKDLFIRILYFGKFENWLKEKKNKNGTIILEEIDAYKFQNHQTIVKFITNFSNEMKQIGEHILKNNTVLKKEIKNKKKKENITNYNEKGAVVSFFLQEYEFRILKCVFEYCCEKKYTSLNLNFIKNLMRNM